MDVSRTEDEQVEALKKWWSENGIAIVAGIVIGIGAIFGWRGWQTHQQVQAEAASRLYAEAIVNIRQGRNTAAQEAAGRLLNEYSRTGYAAFAALMLARLHVEENDLDAALMQLQWVLDHADVEELKHLARIRMARVYLARQEPEQALAVLDVSSRGEFIAMYEELKGDAYMQLNQIEQARSAYQIALTETDNPAGSNPHLQMKLDDIGRTNP